MLRHNSLNPQKPVTSTKKQVLDIGSMAKENNQANAAILKENGILNNFELLKQITNEYLSYLTPVEPHLRLYNQYPGNYTSFAAMTADLPRIAKMGFKQVWVNPFYVPCQSNFIDPKKTLCPYAMQDHTKVNPEFADSFEDIKHYTSTATGLGLIPIFDLVANHVAIDHTFVQGDRELLEKGIDTKKWFKRHPNGNLMMKGMDENYKKLPTSSNPWSDVAIFDYSKPEIAKQIYQYFWKDFIRFNIEELGFMGVRVDAPGRVPRVIHNQLIKRVKKSCYIKHNAKPYVIAETVGSGMPEQDRDMINGVATHTMNSSFWMPGPEGRFKRDGSKDNYEVWLDDDGLWIDKLHQKHGCGLNWYASMKGVLQQAAPTAGHSGSHDEERYPHMLEKMGVTDPVVIKQRMLEMIMVAAFGSDGGHILAFGDEYGIKDQVNLHHRKVVDINKKLYDLSDEIRDVNAIVDLLPKPVFPQWNQRVFYPKFPELVIFIVHPGEGFRSKPHLIIGNSYNDEDKKIVLTKEMLKEIMHANGRNDTQEKQQLPAEIFLCGKINAHEDVNVLTKVIEKPRAVLKAHHTRRRPGQRCTLIV